MSPFIILKTNDGKQLAVRHEDIRTITEVDSENCIVEYRNCSEYVIANFKVLMTLMDNVHML